MPEEWVPAGIEALQDDPPLTQEQLDQCDGVLTVCAFAIAHTGTIMLEGAMQQGGARYRWCRTGTSAWCARRK